VASLIIAPHHQEKTSSAHEVRVDGARKQIVGAQ
jgi:hypothetical protein